MNNFNLKDLVQIDEFRWLLPKQGRMRTEALIYMDRDLLRHALQDVSISQLANVAALPGIVGRSLAMPDMHQGYGFPIGGVAAFDPDAGIVSPGGVGYDINCGVRLLRSAMLKDEISSHLDRLVNGLFANIPTGVGSRQKHLKLDDKTLKKVLRDGAGWAIKNGYGNSSDLLYIEEGGALDRADPEMVSARALERGRTQLGTLGSGNHFVEIGYVETVFDEELCSGLGLFQDQVTVFIHTGSRGLGHQVCDDFIRQLQKASIKYGIDLPDRQLCCAPIKSAEGQGYLSAMAAAANYAFANRQLITNEIRRTFERILGLGEERIGLGLVYDVCHNIAKFEEHNIEGVKRPVLVHRKGATRAFPAHHPQVPEAYRSIGQPVLIPGDMGRYSYVLVGTDKAMNETFGSTSHGAGRLMSRQQAKKTAKGQNIISDLAARGIKVIGADRGTIVEEIPQAYKDVKDVVRVVHESGIARMAARLRPLGVIKG